MLPINHKVVVHTQPDLIDDAIFTVDNEIDTLGWEYCTIYIIVGATDIGLTGTFAVQESETSGSGYTSVTGLIWGTSTTIDGATSTSIAADDDNKIKGCDIDLVGRKRYLKVLGTVDDGTNGMDVCIIALLSRGKEGVGMDSASARGCEEILRV